MWLCCSIFMPMDAETYWLVYSCKDLNLEPVECSNIVTLNEGKLRFFFFLRKHFERIPQDIWMDSQFEAYGSIEEPSISLSCGHNFLSSNVYQLSPIEVFFSKYLVFFSCFTKIFLIIT